MLTGLEQSGLVRAIHECTREYFNSQTGTRTRANSFPRVTRTHESRVEYSRVTSRVLTSRVLTSRVLTSRVLTSCKCTRRVASICEYLQVLTGTHRYLQVHQGEKGPKGMSHF